MHIGSDVPVLSSLVIQDEYSMPLDGHYPTFELCHVDNQKLWGQQIERLFVFKMSEVMRVLFMMQLLLTGPEVEQGFTYSEVHRCVCVCVFTMQAVAMAECPCCFDLCLVLSIGMLPSFFQVCACTSSNVVNYIVKFSIII